MRSMDEAPRDGTRFLAKYVPKYFDGWPPRGKGKWVPIGTIVAEVFYNKEEEDFCLWLGSARVSSTDRPTFTGWEPMPEQLKE